MRFCVFFCVPAPADDKAVCLSWWVRLVECFYNVKPSRVAETFQTQPQPIASLEATNREYSRNPGCQLL